MGAAARVIGAIRREVLERREELIHKNEGVQCNGDTKHAVRL